MKNIIKIIFLCVLCIGMLSGCGKEKIAPDNVKKVPSQQVEENKPSKTSDNNNIKKDIKSDGTENLSEEKTTDSVVKSDAVLSGNSPADTANSSSSVADNITKGNGNGKIIVIDPGHGKSSSLMTDQEKLDYGFTYVQGRGWGEWRHFKSNTMWHDCEGSGCSGRAPQNGSCWYSIGSGDRNTEPELNYNNALNAKKYLESMGYIVRLTRGQNENPSITHRIKKCYPNDDTSLTPDASAYVCIHANAGGGRGSCYISLSGLYDQSGKSPNYIAEGNSLGKSINDSITQKTSMPMWGNGAYSGYPELVLFCKSPVPVAYMEIGFYDNATDLSILQNESDAIGKAIAEGIDAYYNK